jgi:hypothetical protein
VWRWRTELTLAVLAGAGYAWLPITTAIAVLAALALALVLPWSRRWLTARAWCVASRHRLQRLCFETRMHTRSGAPAADPLHPPDEGR